ncbi:hypothetical protein OG21DRAFT_1602790 [Imleria badia]|nr:hypothetical protein OG21DRAFT_1602790 [Imleria badia]
MYFAKTRQDHQVIAGWQQIDSMFDCYSIESPCAGAASEITVFPRLTKEDQHQRQCQSGVPICTDFVMCGVCRRRHVTRTASIFRTFRTSADEVPRHALETCLDLEDRETLACPLIKGFVKDRDAPKGGLTTPDAQVDSGYRRKLNQINLGPGFHWITNDTALARRGGRSSPDGAASSVSPPPSTRLFSQVYHLRRRQGISLILQSVPQRRRETTKPTPVMRALSERHPNPLWHYSRLSSEGDRYSHGRNYRAHVYGEVLPIQQLSPVEILDESSVSQNSSKKRAALMYLAINTVVIESCVVGKWNHYRRSDLERVTGSGSLKPRKETDPKEGEYGLAAFGNFLAENNMIASASWHELDVPHDLSCDVARNAIGKMTLADYVWRCV